MAETMHTRAFPFTGSGGYGYVAYRTKDMELIALSVLCLQGSDAGQKYFKI